MEKLTNLNKKLVTVHGLEFQGGDNAKIRYCFIDSLGGAMNISGEEKIRAYALALKIRDHKGDEIEIEDQDAELLKKCIGEQKYVTQVYAQLLQEIK